jgi:hypothetical protein
MHITGTTQVKGANNSHRNWIVHVCSNGKENTVRSCSSITYKLPIYIWGEAILIFDYNLFNTSSDILMKFSSSIYLLMFCGSFPSKEMCILGTYQIKRDMSDLIRFLERHLLQWMLPFRSQHHF